MIRGEGDSPLSDVRAALGHISPRRLFVSMAGLAALGYLASGLFIVAPGEIGVDPAFWRSDSAEGGTGLALSPAVAH